MKYLSNHRYRQPRWLAHDDLENVRGTIRKAKKKRNDLELFVRIDGDYKKVPRNQWEEVFGE